MRNLYTIILSLAIALIVGLGSVQAQVVDVCAGNDSVVLKLGNFHYGYVQWQVSDDNEAWFDIDGAIDTVYRFLPQRPQYYRAEVRFPACADSNYYSQVSYVQMPPKASAGPDLTVPAGTIASLKATQVEGAEGEWNIIEGVGGLLETPTDCHTGFIGEEGEYKLTWTVTNSCGSNTDTVLIKCVRMEYQSDLVIVDETDAILSDSTQQVNGEYIISFNDPVPDIHEGSVLLGYMYPSFLRKVVSFEREGNMFTMQTEAGALTDVIMSGALNFDPIIDATNGGKPTVKYLDRFPTRKEMQEDPFLLRDGSIYYIKDAGKWNTPIDFEFEVELSSEGYLSFNLLEFDFKKLDNKLDGLKYSSKIRLYPNFDANFVFDNLDFKEARIGFYDARLEYIQNIRLTKPLSTTLVNKAGYFNKNQIMAGGFLIGPIPTFVMIDLPYIFKVQAAIEPPMSFTKTDGNTYTFEMYYNYETGSFKTTRKKGIPFHKFTSEKPIGSIGAEFETGIKASILLADVFGPYFGVSGHFDPSICASSESGDIGGNIHMSVDLSLGCRFQLFSHNLTLFDRAVDFRVIDYNEPAPKKLIKNGGDNQVYTFGQFLNQPVSVKVKGWFNTPMPLAYVHFEPEHGVVSDSIVVTDIHGIASTQWKPGIQYGIDKLRVKLYDCYGNLAGETPQTFYAYSSATDPCINSNLTVEAYEVSENTIIPRVSGENPPFRYSTDGENYSTSIPTIHTEPGQNYHLCVRDSRGCEAETWYNAPPVNCDNSSLQLGVSVDGNTITAVAMGSIWQPFQYSIGGSFQSSPIFSDLFDGEYTVSVRDRVGCERSRHVVIYRPGNLNISLTEITDGSGNAMVLTETNTLIDRGICWSTHHTPTVQDFHNSYGPGSGYYTFTITALDPNKTYYVRAYALDASGTSYSREVCINPTPNTNLPVVAATGVTNVTQTTAVGSGNVTYDGGTEVIERGICWGLIHNPTISNSHVSCGSGTGAFTANITGLTPDRKYYARAYATNSYGTAYSDDEVEFFTGNGGGGGGDHEYVDLGLPSGTLWATCNVGANAPEEYGDYFAWGETTPKDYYAWSTYQYCNGSYNTLTKYCPDPEYGYNGFTDYLTTLLPEDDAATVNWGSEWRMPTVEEWEELCNNTWGRWIYQNGVFGWLFTARNGNSLYLPAAGYRWDDVLSYAADDGRHWSSSFATTDHPDRAWYFYFDSFNLIVRNDRYCGQTVRAVRSSPSSFFGIDARPNPTAGGTVSGAGIYAVGAECTLTATASAGYVFRNWAENGTVISTNATYTFTVTGYRELVANFELFSGGTHEYVDLGLPSGTLWATCNVGANSPEEYGDYFAWGDIYPKNYYDWNTYQYCNGNFSTLTKYCCNSSYGYNGFTDNLTTLLPEDDAATVNWGNGWRMPTKEEWEELLNNTTHTWTTQNGVNGRLFTASNGNSLFLPAAGDRRGTSVYNVGSRGYYWSNSLYSDDPRYAWSFVFYSDYYYDVDGFFRHCGQSVRAVRSSQSGFFGINATPNPPAGGTVSGAGTYAEGAECTLTATASTSYVFSNWTENGIVVSTNAVYTFRVTGNRNLVANFVVISGNDHEYVDLGLPSGTLWATCNVGANSPEEYGDYFAWGETTTKDHYDWSTYQYCNGSYNTLTKYCNKPNYGYNGFTDNLTTLLSEDDAVIANWGNGWRMPTEEEWEELFYNTTNTWATQNGVKGRIFTAGNGSSLFLPAAGYRWDDELDGAGSYGGYWSSALYTDYPYFAWYFGFNSGGPGMNGDNRYDGLSVRAVRSNASPIGEVPEGAINGLFSVSDGQQVYFSQGNLQYQASTNTWRFAEHQWDYVGTQTPEYGGLPSGIVAGSDNSSISSNYNGWIDLFGWGTSGYNHGAVCYQPWSTSTDSGDYYAYGSDSYNLSEQTGQADWGYNAISNGGNQEAQWHTLSQSEWDYVFNTRDGMRYANACVNSVNGIILLPDGWSATNYPLNNVNQGSTCASNIISSMQWEILEQLGAVFLPVAGGRYGSSVAVEIGNYWSESYWESSGNNDLVFALYFTDNGDIDTVFGVEERCFGYSVRLVYDVVPNPTLNKRSTR